jgi:NTP pyrophosphatase (non-canonical NTP hydrolase)
MMSAMRLDDLYYMISRIYSEQNAVRSAPSTFAHFVEVCGMLTIHDRKKKRESVNVESALCKALGWFFPLLAKFRVKSVEELIFRKYPYVCPYCRRCPHEDSICKTVKGTIKTVDHSALNDAYALNIGRKPGSLTDWQRMFAEIYPRRVDETYRSTIGLFEEVGELAEAIRVFERYPKYFAGEAADVFSYLMGMANEHALRIDSDEGRAFSLEEAFAKSYPGLCTQCGNQICICPAIPDATVGRLAKELDLIRPEEVFGLDFGEAMERGRVVSQVALAQLGGHLGIIESFPVDRGETNRTMMMLYLGLAQDADNASQSDLGDKLRAAAVRIGSTTTSPGSRDRVGIPAEELALVRSALDARSAGNRKRNGGLVEAVERLVGKTKVLFVASNPPDGGRLDVGEEERTIRESIDRSKYRDSIAVKSIQAATVDDLRRAMLDDEDYTIVHLAGHSDELGVVFSDPGETSTQTSLRQLAELFERYPSVKCVVITGCSALDKDAVVAECTIGMTEEVSDGSAIEFARGFYDAVGAGKDYEHALREGKSAAELKGHACPVRMNSKRSK